MAMKKIVFTIVAAVFFLFSMNLQTYALETNVSAHSAILMDQQSGRVLFEKNAHEKQRIASITKVMTAILAIESKKLEEKTKVSVRAVKTTGSSVYLQPNEEVLVKDLVYGLMLRSGNDAAVAIAEHVGGSLEGFVFMMNEKAKELGMTNTNFANPHGLDDSDFHYSTPYDMALLTKYAMQNETYRTIAGTKFYKATSFSGYWNNKNRLLNMYEYATGGKTGYTKLAKRTLISTATKDDLDLIVVTINAPDDWNDHQNLYETAFKNYKEVQVLPKGKIKEIKESFYKGKVYLENSFEFPIVEGEEEKFEIEYKLLTPKTEWNESGEVPSVVGKAVVTLDGKVIKQLPIYFEQQVVKEKTFFEKFKGIFNLIIGVRDNG